MQHNKSLIGNNNTSLSQAVSDIETALNVTNTTVRNIETDVPQLRIDVDYIDLSGMQQLIMILQH